MPYIYIIQVNQEGYTVINISSINKCCILWSLELNCLQFVNRKTQQQQQQQQKCFRRDTNNVKNQAEAHSELQTSQSIEQQVYPRWADHTSVFCLSIYTIFWYLRVLCVFAAHVDEDVFWIFLVFCLFACVLY